MNEQNRPTVADREPVAPRPSQTKSGLLSAGKTVNALLGGSLLALATFGFGVYVYFNSQVPDPAAKVRKCIAAHGMRSPREVARDAASVPAGSLDRAFFRTCEWPRPYYAQEDGFTEVPVTSRSLPNGSEATFSQEDSIRPPCLTVRLRYKFGSQGTFEQLKAFEVSPADLRLPNGERLSSDQNAAYLRAGNSPYPEDGEIKIARSFRYALDAAECVN